MGVNQVMIERKQVWGVTMCKDEEDVIFHTLLHMAEEGLTGIIVADNNSTDNTVKEINKLKRLLKGSTCEIVLVHDKEVGYYQSKKMTDLARMAHNYGAEWIVPFDADELWVAGDTIANFLNTLPDHVNVVQADLYDHFGTGVDANGPIPFQNMTWRLPERGALPKVAFKWQPDAAIDQGNHSVSMKGIKATGGLEIRHFPYRSWDHFKRKAINGAKAYNATDLPEDMGQHWRNYGKLIELHGEDVVRKEVFEKYFWFFSPVDNGLINDPAPFRRWNK